MKGTQEPQTRSSKLTNPALNNIRLPDKLQECRVVDKLGLPLIRCMLK